MATDPNEVQLTDEQRKLLAQRADETGRSVSELINEMFGEPAKEPRQPKGSRSLIAVLSERGLVGAMRGPGDLSTNPEHMEGFGESRDPASSD
ncbi:MAG: hypothetical protein AAGD11_17680 [Planctomycetota bacterium]